MYVSDTHGFLWHLQNDPKLSTKAKAIFDACDSDKEAVVLPSIVLIESMYICEKKKVELEFQQVLEKLKTASNYYIYPLDEAVALECANLKLKEPHDRIIVATARLLGAQLITNDRNIKDSKAVETFW